MDSEKSVVLPPISNNTPIDTEMLIPLWSAAILETIKELHHLKPDSGIKTIYRHDAGGYKGFVMPFPIYLRQEIREEIDRVAQENGKKLINYLWDCGKPKITLGGPSPDRGVWNQWAIFKLIFNPIINMLQDNAISQLVRDGSFEPWVITREQVEYYVSKASFALKNNKCIIKVYCPLSGAKLEGLPSANVSKHVHLKTYTPVERCIFLSKYSNDYFWDDFNSPLSCDLIAEMEYVFDEGVSGKEVIESTANDLDLVKLGIFILNKQTEPIDEGTCILDIIGRDYHDIESRIRRSNERMLRASGWPNENLLTKDLPHLVNIISALKKQRNKYGDIKDAIWHFGRACLTPLPRDILLESVIGLDGLLVPGGGDSSYRFKLHGAVLLSNDNEKTLALYKKLGIIYKMRSGAAHGESKGESLENARDARMYLSRAIFKISELCDKGKLPCKEKGITLATSLQRLIISKSSLINACIESQC